MVFGARTCFVERRTILNHPKNKRFGTLYVIVVDCYFPEAKKKQLGRVAALRAMEKWQGTPRSEEIGGKYDLESRGSTFPCTRSHEKQETTQQLCLHLLRGTLLVLKDTKRFSLVSILF